MNDYYFPSWSYAPVHTLHFCYAYDTALLSSFAVMDDFGSLTPANPNRWYSLNC